MSTIKKITKASNYLTLTNISFLLILVAIILAIYCESLSVLLAKHEFMGIVLNTISIIFGFFITSITITLSMKENRFLNNFFKEPKLYKEFKFNIVIILITGVLLIFLTILCYIYFLNEFNLFKYELVLIIYLSISFLFLSNFSIFLLFLSRAILTEFKKNNSD
ncbi:hypothetical protein HMPREF3029_03615 [Nosocomiicoccus sp. HMSC059G07]|nr:hypothetical protein HMPREF3029_03615 [Nosocomiicoccus sp. HMSC059G07]